jgi:hypothetical protein
LRVWRRYARKRVALEMRKSNSTECPNQREAMNDKKSEYGSRSMQMSMQCDSGRASESIPEAEEPSAERTLEEEVDET